MWHLKLRSLCPICIRDLNLYNHCTTADRSIITQPTPWSTAKSLSQWRNSSHFMESGASWPCSQTPATSIYPKPQEFSPHPNAFISLSSNIMLYPIYIYCYTSLGWNRGDVQSLRNLWLAKRNWESLMFVWPCILNMKWFLSPTWCNNYELLINQWLNMFRAPLCPSSGVQGRTLLHLVFSTVKIVSQNKVFVLCSTVC